MSDRGARFALVSPVSDWKSLDLCVSTPLAIGNPLIASFAALMLSHPAMTRYCFSLAAVVVTLRLKQSLSEILVSQCDANVPASVGTYEKCVFETSALAFSSLDL